MAQLRITSPILQGAVYKLDGEYFTVGRESDNTIQIGHTSISKHHAMLTIDKDDFKLWDLHSTNGIIVNGEKTVIRHLKDGDRVVLGDVELRFEMNGSAPIKPPEAVPETKRETQVLAIIPPAHPVPQPPPAPAKPLEPSQAKAPAAPISTAIPLPKPSFPPVPPPPQKMPVVPPVAIATPAQNTPATLVAPPPTTEVESKKKNGLFAKFLHHRNDRPEAHLPVPPPSREEIRAGLKQTFTKMGVEMPIPASRTKPPEAPPAGPVAIAPPPPAGTVATPATPVIPAASTKAESEKTRSGFLFRRRPEQPKPEPAPTREQIHTGLETTFTKMGVEMPIPTPVVKPPVYSPPRQFPATAEAELPVVSEKVAEPVPPATLPKAVAPEPAPAPVSQSAPPKHSYRSLICALTLIAGLVLLGLGYAANSPSLKFLGFLGAITGFISLVFALRFGGIIAPPRD